MVLQWVKSDVIFQWTSHIILLHIAIVYQNGYCLHLVRTELGQAFIGISAVIQQATASPDSKATCAWVESVQDSIAIYSHSNESHDKFYV